MSSTESSHCENPHSELDIFLPFDLGSFSVKVESRAGGLTGSYNPEGAVLWLMKFYLALYEDQNPGKCAFEDGTYLQKSMSTALCLLHMQLHQKLNDALEELVEEVAVQAGLALNGEVFHVVDPTRSLNTQMKRNNKRAKQRLNVPPPGPKVRITRFKVCKAIHEAIAETAGASQKYVAFKLGVTTRAIRVWQAQNGYSSWSAVLADHGLKEEL